MVTVSRWFCQWLLCFALLGYCRLAFAEKNDSRKSEKPVLRILNWNDYIDINEKIPKNKPIAFRSPTLLQFMNDYDCIIQYDEYMDTEDVMEQAKFKQYDIVVVSNIEIPALIKKGWVAKLDKKQIPNLKFIDDKYLNIYSDPKNNYSVPYLVGTTGLIYRMDLLKRPVESLKQYFEPEKGSTYKICLYDEAGITFPFAMLYLQEDIKLSNLSGLKKSYNLLKQLKKSGRIGCISSDVSEMRKKLTDGSVAIAIMYSGDALKTMEMYPKIDLSYTLPEEGGEFYIDSFVVSAFSKHKGLVYKFMNYILRPEVHAAIATDIKYCTPNKESLKVVKKIAPDQLKNPAIYPPLYILGKLYFFLEFDKSHVVERYWQELFGKE